MAAIQKNHLSSVGNLARSDCDMLSQDATCAGLPHAMCNACDKMTRRGFFLTETIATMRQLHAFGISVVVLSIGFVIGTSAHRSSPDVETPQAVALKLSNEIMSPFCPGLTLAACPSGAAARLRSEIAARLGDGESQSQVLEWLIARFGEDIRATPRPRGVALSLWIVPGLLGGVILWGLFSAAGGLRQTRAAESGPHERTPDTEPELESRLDEELFELS
jgi:cytochrome c-type biogenesis protein CcmH